MHGSYPMKAGHPIPSGLPNKKAGPLENGPAFVVLFLRQIKVSCSPTTSVRLIR
ncbi:hypothetical protein GCM10010917_06680 [Paenibacillus physcomitrellae]|uniref:Uncharacterized protein n=1 Tax=Paenibacillus physcomitrellae TaxID=1619311 RepID=A0ABQ1FPK9_9BACL|nr:hypothetical protein GCM10010917_06680 [Paenibacillus physcomitrellae]